MVLTEAQVQLVLPRNYTTHYQVRDTMRALRGNDLPRVKVTHVVNSAFEYVLNSLMRIPD
jgi:hypothetical protein